MTLKNVTLDDKYDLTQSRVFVTGYQALIRACLMQQERDRLALGDGQEQAVQDVAEAVVGVDALDVEDHAATPPR